MEVFGSIWKYSEVLGSIGQYLEVLGKIWKYVEVFGSMWKYEGVRLSLVECFWQHKVCPHLLCFRYECGIVLGLLGLRGCLARSEMPQLEPCCLKGSKSVTVTTLQ